MYIMVSWDLRLGLVIFEPALPTLKAPASMHDGRGIKAGSVSLLPPRGQHDSLIMCYTLSGLQCLGSAAVFFLLCQIQPLRWRMPPLYKEAAW